MAEKISIEIGLDGGAEVQRQLEDIGKSGQQAFTEIKDAADQIDFSDAAAGFQQIGETGVQAFDKVKTAAQNAAVFEQIIQGVRKVEGAFESLGNAVTRVGARMTRSLGPIGVFARALGPIGIALGAVGGAFVKFGDDAADALSKLTVEAAKLGQTPQQFDSLKQALAGLGISFDAIIPGLQKFRETLGEDFTGNPTAALQQFIAELERMPDSVQRTQLAIAKLGEALGGQVIAGLQTGAISARQFAAALSAATPATQEQINQANQYQAALAGVSNAWTQLKSAFTPITTPLLNFLAEELKNLKTDINNLALQFTFLKGVISVFTAGISGGDVGAAARKAAEEYRQLEAQIRNAGAAGAQAGQEAAQGFTVWSEALQQAVSLAQAVGPNAQQAGQQAAQAGQQGAQGFRVWSDELGRAITQAEALARTVQEVKPPDAGGWTTWADTVVGALQSAINKLLEWIGLKDKAGGGGGGGAGVGAPGKARGGLIGGRGSGTSDSNLAWLSRGEYVTPARVVAQPGVLSFLEALRRTGNLPRFADGGRIDFGPPPGTSQRGPSASAVGSVADVLMGFEKIADDLIDGMQRVYATIDQANDALQKGLISAIKASDQVVRNAVRALSALQFQVADVLVSLINAAGQAKKARGGLIGGRGTGTSDSNLAWVSRGEHIMPARAVAQPGMLAFLEALRRSGGNLRGVLDSMGQFALGGLVPRPAFAGGGAVGGMSHVTIQFPGLPPVGGLRASSAVVDELRKAAALAQVRSGGRKPSRYS